MELQCKERVELLEALRDSRKESDKIAVARGKISTEAQPPEEGNDSGSGTSGFIAQGTIPAVNYPDLAKPTPVLPPRPPPPPVSTSPGSLQRPEIGGRSSSSASVKPLSPNPAPAVLPKTSRTPSPDKRMKMKTTLRAGKDNRRTKPKESLSARPVAASSKAAGLAWDSNISHPLHRGSGQSLGQSLAGASTSVSSLIPPPGRDSLDNAVNPHRSSLDSMQRDATTRSPTSPDFLGEGSAPIKKGGTPSTLTEQYSMEPIPPSILSNLDNKLSQADRASALSFRPASGQSAGTPRTLQAKPTEFPPYRSEYPAPKPVSQASIAAAFNPPRAGSGVERSSFPARAPSPPNKAKAPPPPPPAHRRPPANASSLRLQQPEKLNRLPRGSSDSAEDTTSGRDADKKSRRTPKAKQSPKELSGESSGNSSGRDSPEGSLESDNWEERLAYIKKNLPKGVDPWAARQIFNEIVVKGDEVHWSDVAGLEQAKTALKEAVVYPFLRPDLFMGLREPARGMLLFGPPGTGKTMLARAVATESRSTFFAISASSLTSKWLGESEKLVRALFALARALAPSIIFVDEIDSLLSSRGSSSEHESTRRVKTEFLIQWSDLQRAAAGKEQSEKEKRQGDASRVLVLAATNLPWAIDDAARRRFVRRQYIPLPEPPVREEQLRTLLSHQKHSLSKNDIRVLVKVTDGKLYPCCSK